MAIKLFNSQTSMFREKVRVVFALKKVPYEVIDVRADERKSLLEYTNQRKVPTVNYNGECVIDSTVISARLEKDHPQNSIYPEGANNKGLCLAIEDWSDEVLIHANHAMRRADNPEAKQKAEAEWDSHFKTLDQMYAGKKFIFDNKMTLAEHPHPRSWISIAYRGGRGRPVSRKRCPRVSRNSYQYVKKPKPGPAPRAISAGIRMEINGILVPCLGSSDESDQEVESALDQHPRRSGEG